MRYIAACLPARQICSDGNCTRPAKPFGREVLQAIKFKVSIIFRGIFIANKNYQEDLDSILNGV